MFELDRRDVYFGENGVAAILKEDTNGQEKSFRTT